MSRQGLSDPTVVICLDSSHCTHTQGHSHLQVAGMDKRKAMASVATDHDSRYGLFLRADTRAES